MSPRSSKPKKPKAEKKSSGNNPIVDVYTGLLFAGFVAVLTGCILLVVELSKYDWATG